jgi:hypothetical protein
MLPPVLKPFAVPVVHLNANIWAPVTGGVIVVTGVVPEIVLRNVCGAIVAAEAITGGVGCLSLCTEERFWKRLSLILFSPSIQKG